MIDKDLQRLIDRFYGEMDKGVSYDLAELACYLVPKLQYIIEQLEQENLQLYGFLNIISDSIDGVKHEIDKHRKRLM